MKNTAEIYKNRDLPPITPETMRYNPKVSVDIKTKKEANPMSEQLVSHEEISRLISNNELLVTRYYKLVSFFLLFLLLAHVIFSACQIVIRPSNSTHQVLEFISFNIVALLIEVILCRIAFMLGSRSGQLRDLHLSVLLAHHAKDPRKLELVSRTIMSLRREHTSLKVMDIENIVSAIKKNSE